MLQTISGSTAPALAAVEHALRVVDRALVVLHVAVDEAQVAVGLQDLLAIAEPLVQVQRAQLVLQRPRQLALPAPVFAPGLLEHGHRLVAQRMLRAQPVRLLQRAARARVVAQRVEPGELHQRGDVLFDHLHISPASVSSAPLPSPACHSASAPSW